MFPCLATITVFGFGLTVLFLGFWVVRWKDQDSQEGKRVSAWGLSFAKGNPPGAGEVVYLRKDERISTRSSREVRISWYQLFSVEQILVGEPSRPKRGREGHYWGT